MIFLKIWIILNLINFKPGQFSYPIFKKMNILSHLNIFWINQLTHEFKK
jgi:hypothetical protein